MDAPPSSLLILLAETARQRASDLHVVAGAPPTIRLHGALRSLAYPALTATACDELVRSILSPMQAEALRRDLHLCFTHVPRGEDGQVLGHFRVAVHMREGVAEAAIRSTPAGIRSPVELGLPPGFADFAQRDTGLVLITGPTGSGKTTTMNCLIDQINQRQRRKIVLIEDPVEYRHSHQLGLVVQIEVGIDMHSFAAALRHGLREDPDVIAIGELRDPETIATALTAAETGHLVLATLHTPSAVATVHRVLDALPAASQAQARAQLAASLSVVLAQRLLPRADGRGRVLACELMIANDAIRNLIREDRMHLAQNVIITSRSVGMYRLEDQLRLLLEQGTISRHVAAAAANDPRIIADLL